MTMIIYHNPKCSKSRETLALLEQQGVTPQIKLYLQDPLTVAELADLATKLGVTDVRAMMRNKDELYRSLQLDQADVIQQQLLETIVEQPALLERPIVVNGDKAKIGRPPESVLTIL